MNQEFVQKMKEKLLAERARIESELTTIGERDPKNPENFNATMLDVGSSEDDSALETTLYNDRLSQEQTLERLLEDINSALQRMDEGTYGICKYCKKEMVEERLEARPEASACVDCKKRLTMEA